MKFMMIVKAHESSENGVLPSEELLAEMAKYNQQLVDAGVLVDLAGLQPSSKGMRIKFSGAKRTIIDGPFAETKELIAGYWLIEVKSKEEAIKWAMLAPAPCGTEEGAIELRQLFDLDDFTPSAAVEQHRKVGEKLASR